MFQSHFDEILYSQIDFFLVGRTHYGLEGERRRSSFSVRGAIGFNGTKADPGAAFGSAIRLVATDDAHVENARAKEKAMEVKMTEFAERSVPIGCIFCRLVVSAAFGGLSVLLAKGKA